MRNDLKAAMDKIDAQYLNEIVGGTGEPGEVDTQFDLRVHEADTTIEELEVHSDWGVAKATIFVLNSGLKGYILIHNCK